jgi:hypothetical protein
VTGDHLPASDEIEPTDAEPEAEAGGSLLSSLNRLEGVASDVEEWARRWALRNDPYVDGVIEAIRDRSNVTEWAALDALELLPHPQDTNSRPMRAASRWLRLSRVIAAVRNIMVFVPVAVTWWGIYEATSAFNALRGTSGADGATFMDVWVTGAGDPNAAWTIQQIAQVDAILIAAIVILSLLAGMIGARGKRRLARTESAADSERMQVGLALARALHGRRSSNPESIAESVAEVLNDLTEAARSVAGATQELTSATTSVNGLQPVLEQLRDGLERAAKKTTTDVKQGLDELITSIERLTTWVDTDPIKVLDGFAGRIDGFTQHVADITAGVERTSASLEFGTMQLRADLEALSDLLAGLTERQPA